MMTDTTDRAPERQAIVERLRAGQRFVIASHVRPDGDAIGSQLAMALALRALGKQVRIINEDAAPPPLQAFPGVPGIEVAREVTETFDAAIIMECGDLARTGVRGLDRSLVINIDHHPGNTMYGGINWLDLSAAACGEMVLTLVDDLGVPLSREIATHVYIAILTDTGSFHFSNITPRTFDIARRCVEAGVEPPLVARQIFDSNNVGRLKLFGAVLSGMELDDTGRLAIVCVDRAMKEKTGGTYDDTEGLVNLPLTVKEIQAVVFFKEIGDRDYRISMRSKGEVDTNAVAKEYGGGGHKNASGCSARGSYAELKELFKRKLSEAIRDAEAKVG